jgi:hypothetical protein
MIVPDPHAESTLQTKGGVRVKGERFKGFAQIAPIGAKP